MDRLLPAALLLAVFVLPGTAMAQTDLDCGDFTYREDAQVIVTPPGGGGAISDDGGDADGLACESQPLRGSAIPTTTPPVLTSTATAAFTTTTAAAAVPSTTTTVVIPSHGDTVDPPKTLPRTGLTSVPLAVIGTALLAMGFVLIDRRRS